MNRFRRQLKVTMQFVRQCMGAALIVFAIMTATGPAGECQELQNLDHKILAPGSDDQKQDPQKKDQPGLDQAKLALPEQAPQKQNRQDHDHKVLIRDVASVEGIRYNSLIGYGLVVGLKGTGDKQQTYFTIQTLASILQRMGVEIPPSVVQSTVQVKNVAAVFVTASLPPFSRPGMPLDVIVSSAGDARSLEGGLLLLTPLYAADGQV